jgi:hypothetical protein
VAAPEAFNVPEVPGQMPMEGTESTGLGFTVTTAVSEAEQPLLVPVTV